LAPRDVDGVARRKRKGLTIPTLEPAAEQPLRADDGRPRLTWGIARRHLAAGQWYWLATTRSDGAPHVMPVLAVWLEDALYTTSSPAARKARNLAHDARCVVTVDSPPLHLVLEGRAARVRDDATLQRVATAYAGRYDWHVSVRDGMFDAEDGAPTAGPPPYQVYAIGPTTVFGLGTDASLGATRWRF
jgi:hypothetical protein